MGILRFFLALLVVIDHTCSHFSFMPSQLAVSCFFAVSGFYMQMILPSYVRQGKWWLDFYKSRFLRIYPTYYFFCFLTIFLISVGATNLECLPRDFFTIPDLLKPFPYFLYLLTNIFIVGLEAYRFYFFDPINHTLVFAPMAPFSIDTAGSHFMVIGQAWSISSELIFYLFSPLLLTMKNRWVILFTTLSFIIRIALSHYGFDNEQIRDSFLLNNWGLFLTGALSYRFIYLPLKNYSLDQQLITRYYWIAITLVGFFFATYYHLPFFSRESAIEKWFYFFAVVIVMPFLFYARKSSPTDRFIGDLSYPLYLGHMIVMATIRTHIENIFPPIIWDLVLLLPTLLITTLISLFTIRYIEQPLDNYRHKKYSGSPSIQDENLLNTSPATGIP